MWKKLTFPAFILAIAFIFAGDRLAFLPAPVRALSYNSRAFLGGLWPDWLRPKDRNEGRQDEIDRLEGN